MSEKKCIFCERPATKLICCDDCQPIAVKYDSVRILQAYSKSAQNSARIIVFQKWIDKDNQHCLLQIKVSGGIPIPQDTAYKSVDEALTAGKKTVQYLFGEEAEFKEVTAGNPSDAIRQIKLLAGIRESSN